MDALRKLQYEFLDYLLDDSALSIVERVASSPQRSAQQRMYFYGNAYVLRLKEALSTDYERLHAYLGDALFDSLLQQYIKRYPSHHPSLRYYGQSMLELVKQLKPFSELPEVAEIARIEQAFGNSFDAADAPCVTINQLSELEPDAWPGLSLRFRDTVQLLPQHHNSFQIWRALAAGEAPPPKVSDPATWLIWRQDLVSRYRALDIAELAALRIALAGANFAEVCEALLEHYPDAETPRRAVGFLQQWIHDQLLVDRKSVV